PAIGFLGRFCLGLAPARDRLEGRADVRHLLHPLADAGEISVGLVAAGTAEVERARLVPVDAVGADDVVEEPTLRLEAAHVRLAALVQNRLRWADYVHHIPLVVARCEEAAGARSFRLAADGFEDRHPARELVLENARRRVGPDVAHRLEAEPDELALEVAVGQRLLGDRIDALEDRRRRAGRSENAERGLRHHPWPPRLDPGFKVGRAPQPRLRIHPPTANL